MVNNKANKPRQQQNVAAPKQTQPQQPQQNQMQQHGQKQKNTNNGKKSMNAYNNNSNDNDTTTLENQKTNQNTRNNNNNSSNNNNTAKSEQKSSSISGSSNNSKTSSIYKPQQPSHQQQQQQQHPSKNSLRNSTSSYAQAVGQHANNNNSKSRITRTYSNTITSSNNSNDSILKIWNIEKDSSNTASGQSVQKSDHTNNNDTAVDDVSSTLTAKINPGDILTAALMAPCAKCSKPFGILEHPWNFSAKQYRKSKSYMGGGGGGGSRNGSSDNNNNNKNHYNGRQQYQRSFSDRRSSFDRNFAERNKGFVPIVQPLKPVLSSSTIAAVIADTDKLTLIEHGKGRTSYPIMQCGTLDAPDSTYHQQRSNRMDVYQIDDGFHSDGGTETPPPSPSSGSSIASTSDHGSLESVDTGGTQRLAVLSFEQVRKLHDVMDEKVAIHGRGNFPTLEVKLKDLVNSVRRKLETEVNAGGAGVIVKDIRLNGGAASHVLASEDQPYNDLDLIFAIELTSPRHFDRVKTAVLNTLLDLLPEGVSKRRIMPCALKEAYVGKMVKVNNNNDGDRWSLISLGNSPGHKNVELKFVDTMRRQFEFSVDSFQIVLDSLLLFYDCAALPISENFYPTVVGESVYGDFQEALYHLQKKLISTRQPEEIRGGGLLKYCNLLVRNYKPVDPQRIKTLERYMCSRFFIDFPDINTQTVKLEAYLRNHFWGVDEEPMQYQYLMHLREVVEMSTVCLMGHERRQTLLLIQSLAARVLYTEQQKHHAQAQEQYHQQQQQQVADMQQQQSQQQTIYLQQAPQQSMSTTICCTVPTSADQQTQQQQAQQQTATASVPQTIQIQAGPPGLIYANGVYYAPVIPTTICTCNSTWLST